MNDKLTLSQRDNYRIVRISDNHGNRFTATQPVKNFYPQGDHLQCANGAFLSHVDRPNEIKAARQTIAQKVDDLTSGPNLLPAPVEAIVHSLQRRLLDAEIPVTVSTLPGQESPLVPICDALKAQKGHQR